MGKPQAFTGIAKDIAESLPEDVWQRLSAGDGAKGERLYDCVCLDLADPAAEDFDAAFVGVWARGLLIRRDIADGDLAVFYPRCS